MSVGGRSDSTVLVRGTAWCIALLLAALPVVLGVQNCVGAVRCAVLGPPPRPFRSDVWRSGKAPARLAMVDDLVDRHLGVGMERERIVALLGKPDARAVEERGDEGLSWWLGTSASPVSGLTLSFDPGGRLRRWRLEGD